MMSEATVFFFSLMPRVPQSSRSPGGGGPQKGERRSPCTGCWRTLREGGVRLVAVSAVSNVTGEALPLGPICEEARSVGALLPVAGAQAAGGQTVALEGADPFAVAGHPAARGAAGPLPACP